MLVSCKSHINPEISRIPGALRVTLLEYVPFMTWCNSSNTVHCLYSHAIAWQSPFWHWHARRYVQAEKRVVRKPCRRRTELSSKVSISASAPDLQRLEEGGPLWSRANINVPAVLPADTHVLRIAEKKKPSLYVPERNQCPWKSWSPVKEKRYHKLSRSVHCQKFSPRMGFNTGFPELPVHHSTRLCHTGTSPASLLRADCLEAGFAHLDPSSPRVWGLGTSGTDADFPGTGMLLKMLYGD